MEDIQIIELYYARSEVAIKETHVKYGGLLHSIAFHLLSNHEDSEEMVNDTYERTWNSIPPQRPKSLRAYLGRITRNLSINRRHEKRTQKRYPDAQLILSELGDCVPGSDTVETKVETMELVRIINRWLGELPLDDRVLFMRRYWFGEAVNGLAIECASSPNRISGRLYRLRQGLKKALEEEESWL